MEINVEMLSQMIGSLGFPIICCGYMMITMNQTLKADTEATKQLASLIQRLLDKLEVKDVE